MQIINKGMDPDENYYQMIWPGYKLLPKGRIRIKIFIKGRIRKKIIIKWSDPDTNYKQKFGSKYKLLPKGRNWIKMITKMSIRIKIFTKGLIRMKIIIKWSNPDTNYYKRVGSE